MTGIKTTTEWEIELGRQLRSLRLRRNITQQQLAEQAGVALNAVKKLEAGTGSTLASMVKVVRTLERTDWLESLAPAVTISPLRMLKTKSVRRRASRKKGVGNV